MSQKENPLAEFNTVSRIPPDQGTLANAAGPASSGPIPLEQGGRTDPAQDVAALKRDIVSLKKQAEKRHKPWYLDYSKTIPIFISVVTVAISIYSQRAEDVQKELETLSETIGQIVDLRKENTEKMMSGADPALLQAESVLLNQKKLALQEKARVLLRDPKVRTQVSPDEIRILATEFGYSGEVKEAEQLLRSALVDLDSERKLAEGKEDQKALEKAYVLAGLAYWEMVNDRTPGVLATARNRMQEAVDIFKKQGGEYSKESLVQIYISWSSQELVTGNIERSHQELQNAEQAFKSIDPLNSNKIQLGSLCLNMQRYIHNAETRSPTQEGPEDPMDWYGNWNVSFDNPHQRQGSLLLNWNKQTNAVEARVELFDGTKLVEHYAGTGGFPSASQLRIDWAQVWRITNPPAQAQPTLGYTLFTFRSPQNLKIDSYLLGESPTQGKARKAN